MDDHKCQHEGDLAVIKDSVKRIDETTTGIFKILNGNGETGLVTKVALNQQQSKSQETAINRLWMTVRIFIIPIGVAILGIGIFIFKKALES
jgi:hypothetical protein